MSKKQFILEEGTIDSIHEAIKLGKITATELVEMYLARIEAYDQKGPKLNSIITVNPKAIQDAEVLDKVYKNTNKFMGPLHGIPVLVKDQIETEGLTTTVGSIAFKDYIPKKDAKIIKKLREAGAIILAKTLLCDFATSWFAISSAAGDTKNPYDLNRNPGGSSGGTAAGIAANLGTVGIGEDTCGSIRLPASWSNLVGLKVTTGLVSRTGSFPLIHFQDTIGPMTRTVKDTAILLDVLAGYDYEDPYTYIANQSKDIGNYSKQLRADALEGARIGVLRQGFGADNEFDCAQVNKVVNKAILTMKDAGATIVDPIIIPNLNELINNSSMYDLQSKQDINNFLKDRPNAPISSFDEIFKNKQYDKRINLLKIIGNSPENPEEDPTYFEKRYTQEKFRRIVLNVIAEHNLDGIVFPDTQVQAVKDSDYNKWEILGFPTNTLIASHTGLPAISVPAGFSEEGIPVGIEILGKWLDELTILNLAYSFEHYSNARKSPKTTPPLNGENK